MAELHVNAIIFGGGAAGLWILDEIRRRGRSALLIENSALGDGQTIASQGIIHSGLKYSLAGLLTDAARETRDTVETWNQCLSGSGLPDLSKTEIRSHGCYLWGTESASSRIGLLGARIGLRSTPQLVAAAERPAPLSRCSGSVYRIDEQVISPSSLLKNLAEPHLGAIFQFDASAGIEFDCVRPGEVRGIRFPSVGKGGEITLAADTVVFAAGQGNAELRSRVSLHGGMQLRPLHVALARGNGFSEFHGHCIDGAKTRVTITSARDMHGRMVWQIAGNLAEDAVPLDRESLIRHAQRELSATLPAVDLAGTEWAAFRIDRAEGATSSGGRPDRFTLLQEGNVLTAWPTKLVLVPRLAAAVAEIVTKSPPKPVSYENVLREWTPPQPAATFWDRPQTWTPFDGGR